MKELVTYIVTSIVEKPDAVDVVEEVLADGKIILTINTDPSDVGLVIGRKGRTINAIRSLVKIKAIKEGKFVDVKVPSNKPEETATETPEVSTEEVAMPAEEVEVQAPTDEPMAVTGDFEEPTF